MSEPWCAVPEPEARPLGAGDWLRIVRRGAPIIALLCIAFPLLLLLRLPEAAIWRAHRPVTPFITQAVCRAACALMGLHRAVQGTPMTQPGAFVSNHVSWLDIFVLNAATRGYFVAKSEVSGWPGIGWLARGTGTVFVERKRGAAKGQATLLEARLQAGHRLMLFPEGTSTDGLRVLRFKSTLFAAFFTQNRPRDLAIQPVSVVYRPHPNLPKRFYGWWGAMGIGEGILQVLAAPDQGTVDTIFHPPLRIDAYPGRKELAAKAETAVRSAFADIDPA